MSATRKIEGDFTLAKYSKLLETAVEAARAAGAVMRKHLKSTKKINSEVQFDIKLDLDVKCQRKIEGILSSAAPGIPTLGEEGNQGDVEVGTRWVVDPIDGTVNFAYGIPHACVSIALQERIQSVKSKSTASHQSVLGVVYDPFQEEMWTVLRGEQARLNGKRVKVSTRDRLDQCLVTIGFGKTHEGMDDSMAYFSRVTRKVRKVRIMGSAALGLAYLATGRLDGYVEVGLSLWDIAAGSLLVEAAGGEFWSRPIPGEAYKYRVVATNGLIRKKLERI